MAIESMAEIVKGQPTDATIDQQSVNEHPKNRHERRLAAAIAQRKASRLAAKLNERAMRQH